ncbi:uncharacterized protein LOC113294352 [Papaver somniferum]|uniref:uncharacterized protein LOC113294352 n=1 Tax=Papaver somniferum TaxID=3469 RepID=UPI000E6FDEE9|nr:uncharacterized protein LOC113294352 [Papaver somniferum]
MARTKRTKRLASQIPNLVATIKAAKECSRTSKNSKPPDKEIALIRCNKNKKDKSVLVTPPSRPPCNQKYLNAGLLRGKTPSEVALIIRKSREPCVDSSVSSPSSSVVISTSPSDEEEEVAEHEEIPLVGGDQGNGGDGLNGGNGGDGLNGGNEVEEIEEEGDQGNDDDEDGDGNGGGSSDEEEDEDDGNDGNGKEINDGSNGDDDEEEEEIQEDEEDAAQPQPKPKEKVPNKPSARHIPPMRLQLTRLPDGKARGEPKDDGKFLFGYDSSWARTINETIDHKNATHLFRHQSYYAKMKKWPLESECPRVRVIVENSGLYDAVQNSVIAYDKAAVSCFTERFYGEVDTFQFPFDEMALIPADAKQIIGLQVEGKSMNDKFNKNLDWKKNYELTEKLFGWDEKKTYGLFVMGKKYPKKEFKLIDIRKMYARSLEKDGDNKLLSDFEVRATAATYLLYVLASVIFPDSKGNRVSVNRLQLLDTLEDVGKYSWGTAIVAHLNAQLAKASRERTSQMNGNLAVCIYEHFPSLMKGDEDIQLQPTWNNTKARGTRYNYTGSQDKEEAQKLKLLAMRQKLDNMIAEEVTFDPYKEDRVRGLQDLGYHDPLFYPYGYSMYNPHRDGITTYANA